MMSSCQAGSGPAHTVGGKDSCKTCRDIPTVTCGSRSFSIQVVLFPCLYHFNRWLFAWYFSPPLRESWCCWGGWTQLLVKQRSQQSWQGGRFLILRVSSTIGRARNLQILFYSFYYYFFKNMSISTLAEMKLWERWAVGFCKLMAREALYPLFWYLLFSNCLIDLNY